MSETPTMHPDGSITLPPNPWVNDEHTPESVATWADYDWRSLAEINPMPRYAKRVLLLIADAVAGGGN